MPTTMATAGSPQAAKKKQTNVEVRLPIEGDRLAPPEGSPREDISAIWWQLIPDSSAVVINGVHRLPDPLDKNLRREIVKYGQFAQATYDGFDGDQNSKYRGSCRYNRDRLFQKVGLGDSGYTVTSYIYAMSHVEVPGILERFLHIGGEHTWSNDSNWMGYVAVSDDKETQRIGRRDIVVAWRGTMATTEWYKNFQFAAEPVLTSNVINNGDDQKKDTETKHKDVIMVEHGFQSMYTSKSEKTRYNKRSAAEQAMAEIKRLVGIYEQRGEVVSLSITGHSLGGALALLNAYDAATTFPNLLPHVSVVTFGGPQLGNAAFGEKMREMGVKVLRVVNSQDVVPRVPGMIPYTHVGLELQLDQTRSPHLEHNQFDVPGAHNLEVYLHLVDRYLDRSITGFRKEARRNVELVNKSSAMLVNQLKVPHSWCEGWLKTQQRDPVDIPSPDNSLFI